MLIRTVIAPFLGAACHVVADDENRCVVVDPGAGVVDAVLALVREHGLVPVAILATHGHVDHTWSAAALCRELGVPVMIHEDDAYRLGDPFGTLGPLGHQLAELAGGGEPPAVPERLVTFGTGPEGTTVLDLEGFRMTALHAPGHTEGSTVYLVDGAQLDGAQLDGAQLDGARLDGAQAPALAPAALTGDVLFAGTIGRTDLPGGDGEAMARSLRRLALLDPGTVVLPGHGPTSTIAAELAGNPYVRT